MLIFGGTGFIGKHLCEIMERNGEKGVVVSRSPDFNFLNQYAPSLKALTLEDFFNNLSTHLASHSNIVYAASSTIPSTFINSPWNELSINVEPAFKLFSEAYRINPNIRIVLLSSGGTVYGSNHITPIREDASLAPISPYGYGKVALEQALMYLGRANNLSYAILRVSNPIGKWQTNPYQGIVNATLSAVKHGQPLNIFDQGCQIRDFLDADELAAAVLLAVKHREFENAIWNVGSGVPTSINQVVELIENILNLKIKKNFLPKRSIDVSFAVLNCDRILKDLQWRANIDLKHSIIKIIESRNL